MDNQSKFKVRGVYSQNDLLNNMKDVAQAVNLHEYISKVTQWIAFYANGYNVTYFDSFRVEHIPEEKKIFITNKNIITNIFRVQVYDWIKSRFFSPRFIDFVFNDKIVIAFTNLHNFEEND